LPPMRRTPNVILPCVLFLAAMVAACRSAATNASAASISPTPSRSDKRVSPELAVLTFDSAWRRIRDSYYDPAMRGVDWNRVRDELRPRAERAHNLGELRTVLREMVGRLGESHFALIPGEIVTALDPAKLRSAATAGDSTGRPGDVGIELRLIGNDVVVWRIDESGPAYKSGVRMGWIVDSVERYGAGKGRATLARAKTESELRETRLRLPYTVMSLFTGDAGTRVWARFLDGARKPVDATLVRRPTLGEPVRFGNLPTILAQLTSARVPIKPGAGGGCVGVIRFNTWMTPMLPAFEHALDSLRDCRGIVIDIRGNLGGLGAMVMGIGGFFIDSVVPLGTMRTRGSEIRFVTNPRRASSSGAPERPYAGPVAVVTDQLSMSTSEIFAAGMQGVGRARVFGDTTGRQALPALVLKLPTGDVLMHAFADFVDPRGRRIEGRGAIPDEAVPLRREALLAGRDEPLDAAIAWIAKSSGK
jgi:carboxyl-terminal processing protease